MKWIILVSIIAAGITSAIVIDFVIDHPLQVAAILLLAVAWASGRSVPFNFTEDALRHVHHPAVAVLREWLIPLAIVAGWAGAVHRLWHHGLGQALVMLTALYVADRVTAWTIRVEQARHHQRVARRRAPISVGTVHVGEPID